MAGIIVGLHAYSDTFPSAIRRRTSIHHTNPYISIPIRDTRRHQRPRLTNPEAKRIRIVDDGRNVVPALRRNAIPSKDNDHRAGPTCRQSTESLSGGIGADTAWDTVVGGDAAILAKGEKWE